MSIRELNIVYSMEKVNFPHLIIGICPMLYEAVLDRDIWYKIINLLYLFYKWLRISVKFERLNDRLYIWWPTHPSERTDNQPLNVNWMNVGQLACSLELTELTLMELGLGGKSERTERTSSWLNGIVLFHSIHKNLIEREESYSCVQHQR